MSKKLLVKYIFMYVPMIVGIILFSSGVVNLFSSLLLFLGGYVAIKNTLDYRMVRKNINSINENKRKETMVVKANRVNSNEKVYVKPMKHDMIPGFKRTRIYSRVRRKY